MQQISDIQIETGYQLLTRISTRPCIENVYPNLFIDGGPLSQQVIEITGNSSSGKTFLITEIIAKCILPDNILGLTIGGKNAGVIIINTDHHFDIFNLKSIMENTLKTFKMNFNSINSQQINDIVKESLKNLIILNCFDSQQLYVTFHSLEKILSENKQISLIILDSISAFYWSDRLNGGIKKIDTYQKTILKLLQSMTKDFKLTIMFTKTTNFSSKTESFEECYKRPTLEKINYRILLEKILSDNSFIANVTLPDNTTFKKCFKISNLITWM